MKQTEDTQQTDDPAANRGKGRRRLTRSRDDRFIGGVAAGLARYFNIDPALVRVAFAVSLVIGGVGVLAYLLLLVMVPVEGDPDTPIPPVTGGRRKVAIAGTIAVGIVLIVASSSGGSGTGWLFGFGPGVLFGIFLWIAVAAALVWTVRQAGIPGGEAAGSVAGAAVPGAGAVTESAGPGAARPGTGSTTGATDVGFAASPSQIRPAAAASISAATGPGRPDGTGDETGVPGEGDPDTKVLPGDQPTEVKAGAPLKAGKPSGTATPPRSTAPSILGKVMTWVAIGLTGVLVLSVLALISFGLTALFGAIPAAVLVIGCGVAVVWLALAQRPQFALWTIAAALAIAIPMAAVTIASLDIEGDWGDVRENPVAASQIPVDGYKMAAGGLKIDLRGFPFRKGETVELPSKSGFGATSVILPDDVCVVGAVNGRVGYIYSRGSDWQGVDVKSALPQPAPGVPVLRLDSEFRIGYFGVFDNSGWKGTSNDWPEDLEDRQQDAAKARATAACKGTPRRQRPGAAGSARAPANISATIKEGRSAYG